METLLGKGCEFCGWANHWVFAGTKTQYETEECVFIVEWRGQNNGEVSKTQKLVQERALNACLGVEIL